MGEDNLRREVANQRSPLQSDHLSVGRKDKVGLARNAMATVMKSHQVMAEQIAVSDMNIAARRVLKR